MAFYFPNPLGYGQIEYKPSDIDNEAFLRALPELIIAENEFCETVSVKNANMTYWDEYYAHFPVLLTRLMDGIINCIKTRLDGSIDDYEISISPWLSINVGWNNYTYVRAIVQCYKKSFLSSSRVGAKLAFNSRWSRYWNTSSFREDTKPVEQSARYGSNLAYLMVNNGYIGEGGGEEALNHDYYLFNFNYSESTSSFNKDELTPLNYQYLFDYDFIRPSFLSFPDAGNPPGPDPGDMDYRAYQYSQSEMMYPVSYVPQPDMTQNYLERQAYSNPNAVTLTKWKDGGTAGQDYNGDDCILYGLSLTPAQYIGYGFVPAGGHPVGYYANPVKGVAYISGGSYSYTSYFLAYDGKVSTFGVSSTAPAPPITPGSDPSDAPDGTGGVIGQIDNGTTEGTTGTGDKGGDYGVLDGTVSVPDLEANPYNRTPDYDDTTDPISEDDFNEQAGKPYIGIGDGSTHTGDTDPDSDSYGYGFGGFIRAYYLSPEMLTKFAYSMWLAYRSSSLIDDWFATFGNSTSISAMLNNIVSLHTLPIDVDTEDTYESKDGTQYHTLNIGGVGIYPSDDYLVYHNGLKCPIVTEYYKTVDLGTIQVQNYFASVLDYDPYTEIQIYLPYIGVRPLNPNDIIGNTLTLQYNVNILTGAFRAMLFIKSGNDSIIQVDAPLYEWSGNLKTNIPFSSNLMDVENYRQSVRERNWAIGKGILAAGFGALTGGAGAAVLGASSQLVKEGNVQQMPSQQLSGLLEQQVNAETTQAGKQIAQNLPNIAQEVMLRQASQANGHNRFEGYGNDGELGYQTPYLIITRPVIQYPQYVGKLLGRSSYQTLQIGKCTGFVRVMSWYDQGTTATESEKAEIASLLKEGVWIDES